jgi:hypothetical protein
MCTILFAYRCWPDPWLLVGANRDERLDRPASAPRRWPGRGIVAPEDLLAHGTWWGLGAGGFFAAVTNRCGSSPPDRSRRSRGLLVLDALARGSARAAAEWAAGLEARCFNRFHLLLADRDGAYLVIHDGSAIVGRELSTGWHVLTERSFGAGDPEREAWADAELRCLAGPPSDGDLGRLLSVHRDDAFAGTCVHAPWLGYGTRSSSILRLGNRVRLVHADGPPCRAPYQDMSELLAGLG